MVFMVRKIGFIIGNVSCYYLIVLTMNFFVIALRYVIVLFVVDVFRLKSFVVSALIGDIFGCGFLLF